MKNNIIIFGLLLLGLASVGTNYLRAEDDVLFVDRMDQMRKNELGGRNSTYVQPPSRVYFSKSDKWGKQEGDRALKIIYDKKNVGGPRDDGGFCGFYSILKKGREGYLDVSNFQYLTFWVRQEPSSQDVRFKVGLADRQWELLDDSFKSEEVGNYLPEGEVTEEWQMAMIPLEDFFIDLSQLAALAIAFEADVFEDGAGRGSVHIDDVAFVKDAILFSE